MLRRIGITFAVDDVTPAAARLAERDVPLDGLARMPCVARSHDAIRFVEAGRPAPRAFGGAPGDRLHALVQSVDLAFREHRPLRITPDAVWITLAQGFSLHVRERAEALRARFVRHEGRSTVRAEVPSPPRGAAWRDVIAGLSEATADALGPGVVALLTRPFSTTDDDAQTVMRIALLETFDEYFEYEFVAVCGIPAVSLEGTAGDWRDIKRRVEVMAEYDLSWWADALLPVCDQWIAAAEGRPDAAFWRAMVRPAAVYGGHMLTGWIARLFPYVEAGEGWARNDFTPVRAIPEDAVKPADFIESGLRVAMRLEAARAGRGEVVPWAHVGVSPRALPASWSRAKVRGAGACEGQAFVVSGGLLGVTQRPDTGALEPAVVWQVEESLEEATWALLEARHACARVTAAPSADVDARYRDRPLRGALLAFYRRFHRATLFDGAVEVDPRDACEGAHPAWERAGLWAFARVRGGGALGWFSRRPIAGAAWAEVSPALPPRLDWFVYAPDATRDALDDAVVVALDGWRFFDRLARGALGCLGDASAAPAGRLVDLLRDPSAVREP